MHQIGQQESTTPQDHSPALEPTGFRDNLDSLLHALQTELTDLSEKRSNISRRIRLLDKTLRGLRAGVGQSTAGPLNSAGANQPVVAIPSTSPGQVESKVRGQDSTQSQSAQHVDSSLTPMHLQRACRIALAEAAGSASPRELYTRIARRGSFPVENAEAAVAAIVRILSAMQEEGEVRCVDEGPHGRWVRTMENIEATRS